MRIGLSINQDGIPYQKLKSIALTAEKQVLDYFWVLDHLHASPRPDEKEILECWTFLSALAAETTQIRIGALVLNINNRNPALSAKMAATLRARREPGDSFREYEISQIARKVRTDEIRGWLRG